MAQGRLQSALKRAIIQSYQRETHMETLSADLLSLIADLEEGLDPEAIAFDADEDLEADA